jgi:hypothetical protein
VKLTSKGGMRQAFRRVFTESEPLVLSFHWLRSNAIVYQRLQQQQEHKRALDGVGAARQG